MKRALILITLTAAIAATAAAQPGPPPPPRGDALANYLQLTDAQKSTWQTARASFEAAVKPLHDQQRAAHEQIEQALSSASPDPTAIGKLMISGKQLGDQIKAAHDALDATLASTLSAEQKAKFEAFKAARPPHPPHPGPPPNR
jgi:Spy/CpxP family protein refolding chaperone